MDKLKKESGIDLGALDMNALIKQKDEDVLLYELIIIAIATSPGIRYWL